MSSIKMPDRLPTYKGKAFTEFEIEAILSYCSDKSYRALWLLVNTGIRLGELFQVSRESFDFARGLLILCHTKNTPLKGKKDRAIPVNDDVLDWAATLDPHQMAYAYGYRYLQHEFTKACESATAALKENGSDIIIRGHLHDLRHTWITNMLRAGVPLRDVQEYAGHASIKTTEGYLHASGETDLHRNAVRFGLSYNGAKKDNSLTQRTFSCTDIGRDKMGASPVEITLDSMEANKSASGMIRTCDQRFRKPTKI